MSGRSFSRIEQEGALHLSPEWFVAGLSRLGHLALAGSLLLLLGCRKDAPPANEPLRVAAAADLAFAFKDVGAAYTKKTGQEVTFSFGSTGLLAKQIAEGAPFDVFAAANVSFADDVVKAGACSGDTKALYATGRIVMWVRNGTPPPPMTVADLADPRWARIAIANPEHAPYGRAAKDAMTKAGVWDKVQPRIVYGENVQQTLQFAQSGNADVAIVALSLATVTEGAYSPIEPTAHERIDQALVACKGKNATPRDGAKRFVAFVNGEEGHAIMKGYGFLLPGEASATSAR
jgi:molybdate transport system substrate-binding protein